MDKNTYTTLVERFGEPIGSAETGQGVNDERNGQLHKGSDTKNRGFGAELEEESCCNKCGMMANELEEAPGSCCQEDSLMKPSLEDDDLDF